MDNVMLLNQRSGQAWVNVEVQLQKPRPGVRKAVIDRYSAEHGLIYPRELNGGAEGLLRFGPPATLGRITYHR